MGYAQEPSGDYSPNHDLTADSGLRARRAVSKRPAPGKSNAAHNRYASVAPLVVPAMPTLALSTPSAQAIQLKRQRDCEQGRPEVNPGALQELGYDSWSGQSEVLDEAWARSVQKASAPPAATAPATTAFSPLDQATPSGVQETASLGFSGPSVELPFHDRIQRSFGRHDVSGVAAHVGGPAAAASDQLGAMAYASGNDVAFREQPDLHTAAHEAAHVVQQRKGVSLKAGVGQDGDVYEQHADRVADAVVRGEAAEPLLDDITSGSQPARGGAAVQRKAAGYQRSDHRRLMRLILQRAAALAREGVDDVSESACRRVAEELYYATESDGVPGGKSADLTELFDAADLAYQRAAELHGAAAATLGDDNSAVTYLAGAMYELWQVLDPAGWRRPANRRDGDRRASRARRQGRKDTFGARDRLALIEVSLQTADHVATSLTTAGKPVTPQALTVTTVEAHRHVEQAFDVSMEADEGLDRLRGAIDIHTRPVGRLEHEALRLNHWPELLADTVVLANRLRDCVGLPALAAAELSPDEFAKWLDAADAFLKQAGGHLTDVVRATSRAYLVAWKRHRKVLDAQKKETLSPSLLEQALQVALVGGLGSVAAHIMKVKVGFNAGAAGQGAIIDGVKDLTKAMAKKGVVAPINDDAYAHLPPDPLDFFLQASEAAAAETREIGATVTAWRVALAQGLLTDRAFNPYALYVDTITVDGTPVLAVAVPDLASNSRVFELAFWRTWLETYAYTVSERHSMVSGERVSADPLAPLISVDIEKNWGDEIVRAIDDLGEDGKAWIEAYGGVARGRAERTKERRKRELHGEIRA